MSSSTIDAQVHKELAEAPRTVSMPQALPVPRPVPAPLRSTGLGLATSVGGASAPVLSRVSELGGRALDQVVYQVRRLGSATLTGIVALATAVSIYISYNMPQGAAVSALQAELAHAPARTATVTPNGAPLASLPLRSDVTDVVAKVYQEAKAAGVELPRGQYEYIPPRDGVAARYRLTFPVRATYPQLRGFLDRTLIALPAVAVEGLRIERKTVGDGNVDAEVKFAAYVVGET